MNGILATASPRIATTTVPPAKTTERPAVARERPTASTTPQTLGEVLAEAGEHEQRVVDADAQADHRPDHGRPARDVDDVGDQGQGAGADREAEQRHPDRQAHGDQGPEGQQQDHDRDEQPEGLADAGRGLLEREVQVAAGLDPQRRRAAELVEDCLEALQVSRARGPGDRGTGRGSARPGRRGRPSRLDCSVPAGAQGAGRIGRAAHLGQRRDGVLDPGDVGLRAGEPKKVAPWSRGVRTMSAPSPHRCGVGPGQQLGGLLRVQPGCLERVLELRARRRRPR